MGFDREYWEGMTRGALYGHIIKLEAKVEKLTAELNNHDYKLGKTVKALQATITELQAKVEGLETTLDGTMEQEVILFKRIEELESDIKYEKLAYDAANKIIDIAEAKVEDLEDENATLREIVEDSGFEADELIALKQEGE